ncbi:MAG: 1-acyl-sn-glycerol-3-phosphate acyltransferase [Alphaproteobacteria bacterium]|nr:1-acyl-sn-glycerol-3-phosphate acyltransferase [Alphaproteobacteria bacterium]
MVECFINEITVKTFSKNFSQILFRLICKIIFTIYAPVHSLGKGNLPTGPFILCSNHSSHLDMGVLIHASGRLSSDFAVLVAMDYWFKASFFKKIFRNFLTLIPVDRISKKKNKKKIFSFENTINVCNVFVKNKGNLIIYPEGSRSQNGLIQPFKKGAAILALRLNIPIVPVYIHGCFKALPKGRKLMKPANIHVYFEKPIYPPYDATKLEDFNATSFKEEAINRLTSKIEKKVRNLKKTYGVNI